MNSFFCLYNWYRVSYLGLFFFNFINAFVSEYKAFPHVYQLGFSGYRLEKQTLSDLTKRKFIGRLFGSSQDQWGGCRLEVRKNRLQKDSWSKNWRMSFGHRHWNLSLEFCLCFFAPISFCSRFKDSGEPLLAMLKVCAHPLTVTDGGWAPGFTILPRSCAPYQGQSVIRKREWCYVAQNIRYLLYHVIIKTSKISLQGFYAVLL